MLQELLYSPRSNVPKIIRKKKKKKRKERKKSLFKGWIRLLRVPWTARRSNQSILKEISPGIFLEGMMLNSPHGKLD